SFASAVAPSASKISSPPARASTRTCEARWPWARTSARSSTWSPTWQLPATNWTVVHREGRPVTCSAIVTAAAMAVPPKRKPSGRARCGASSKAAAPSPVISSPRKARSAAVLASWPCMAANANGAPGGDGNRRRSPAPGGLLGPAEHVAHLDRLPVVGHDPPRPVAEALVDGALRHTQLQPPDLVVDGGEREGDPAGAGRADRPRGEPVRAVVGPDELLGDLREATVDDERVLGHAGAVGPLLAYPDAHPAAVDEAPPCSPNPTPSVSPPAHAQ